jgi:hypothetical protein
VNLLDAAPADMLPENAGLSPLTAHYLAAVTEALADTD